MQRTNLVLLAALVLVVLCMAPAADSLSLHTSKRGHRGGRTRIVGAQFIQTLKDLYAKSVKEPSVAMNIKALYSNPKSNSPGVCDINTKKAFKKGQATLLQSCRAAMESTDVLAWGRAPSRANEPESCAADKKPGESTWWCLTPPNFDEAVNRIKSINGRLGANAREHLMHCMIPGNPIPIKYGAATGQAANMGHHFGIVFDKEATTGTVIMAFEGNFGFQAWLNHDPKSIAAKAAEEITKAGLTPEAGDKDLQDLVEDPVQPSIIDAIKANPFSGGVAKPLAEIKTRFIEPLAKIPAAMRKWKADAPVSCKEFTDLANPLFANGYGKPEPDQCQFPKDGPADPRVLCAVVGIDARQSQERIKQMTPGFFSRLFRKDSDMIWNGFVGSKHDDGTAVDGNMEDVNYLVKQLGGAGGAGAPPAAAGAAAPPRPAGK